MHVMVTQVNQIATIHTQRHTRRLAVRCEMWGGFCLNAPSR